MRSLPRSTRAKAPDASLLSPTERLWRACERGSKGALRKALADGARIDAREPASGLAAVGIATRRGKADCLAILIGAGADVKRAGPRDCAAGAPLALAAQSGDLKCLRLLLAAGADVEAWSGIPERTALIAAASKGREPALRLLIASGAELDACRPNGWAAAHEAAIKGALPCLAALAEAGAKLDGIDGHGRAIEALARGACLDFLRARRLARELAQEASAPMGSDPPAALKKRL